MNSYERFTARLHGLPVDRIPNFDILMARAARHIHVPLSRYYLDHRVLVEANLAAANDFHLDILQAISDPYREAADFGLEVDLPDDNLPINLTPLLAAPEDIHKLVVPDPCSGRRMSDRLEAIRLFREQAGGEIPIMGWVEGALAEACDLRSMYHVMIDLGRRPDWLTDPLEICVELAIAFARAQIEAGADMIGLGDADCSADFSQDVPAVRLALRTAHLCRRLRAASGSASGPAGVLERRGSPNAWPSPRN